MNSEQRKENDWVNLPEGVITLSLWDSLHDGDLLKIESDLLARTITLRFDVPYLRTFHKLPQQTEFVPTVTGLESARLLGSTKWPGPICIPEGVTRDEESKLVADYHAKWREETRSWGDFEKMINDGIELLNATLARGIDAVALRLGVMSFVALGEEYWTAFAGRL